MSRSTSGGGELSESVLDCFTVGGAGGYSVHVYEIQCNGELGHRNRELPDVNVTKQLQAGITYLLLSPLFPSFPDPPLPFSRIKIDNKAPYT